MERIAFFFDYFIIGGAEKVLVTTVNTLVDAGYDVMIVWTDYVEDNAMKRQINPKVRQVELIKELQLEISPKPKVFWKRKLWKIKRWLNNYKKQHLTSIIKGFKNYNYLIDYKNGGSRLDMLTSFPHQKKYVWIHGGTDFFATSNILINNNLLSYNKIICLTDKFKQNFIKKYPQATSQIVRIYNPFNINFVKFKAQEKIADIKKYLPYFLCVSRLDNDKDIMTILKACKIFYCQEGRKNKMIFLGKGTNLQTYQEWVKQEKLEDKIYFLGNSDNPYPWMKDSEALILSSRSEGLPTVLIEGQICGTLVISSNCPDGPAEILEKGKSGILFDVGNAEQLSKIMEDIEDKNIDKTVMIANATQSLSRFTQSEFLQGFDNLLNGDC